MHPVHSNQPRETYPLAEDPNIVFTNFLLESHIKLPRKAYLSVSIAHDKHLGQAVVHWRTVRTASEDMVELVEAFDVIYELNLASLPALAAQLQAYLRSKGANVDFSTGFNLTGQVLVPAPLDATF